MGELMMGSSTFTVRGIDRAALERVVEPIARAHGVEVVDVEFKTERAGWVLRVSVERAGAAERGLSGRDAAVNLELCADISRDLSPALDVADLIPHTYHLEVSSPGLERPLRSERDFARFGGQKAKLRLRQPIDGSPERAPQRIIVGTLDGIADGRVRIVEGDRAHEVPLSNIEKARLVFDFGPSTRSHKRKH